MCIFRRFEGDDDRCAEYGTDILKRTVHLGKWKLVARHDRTAVTPNENAADTLGVRPCTLEDLAREVVGEERVVHPVIVGRLLGEAVGEILGGEGPEGMARSLLSTVRELFRASPDIEFEPSSPRARRVVEVARLYRRLLRERGLIDSSETLREAVRSYPSRRPILVWGYPRLGRDELAFLDAIAGEGSALYLPCAGDALFTENVEAARELQSKGWSVEEEPMEVVWEAQVSLGAHAYPHMEAEVRGVLAQVKELLVDGVPPDDVVIAARDDASYGPTMLMVAKEYGIPVQALYRIPVEQTRVGSWLKLFIDAQFDDFPFEETARLLRHTMGPGISGRCWSEARKVQPRGAGTWEQCGADLSSVDLSRMWPEEDTRAGWVGRFRELLNEHSFERKVRSWTREIVALGKLKDSLEWLAGPAAGPEEESISRERFLEELKETLSATLTPSHPDGEGVALHTPLSLFGARYRYLFTVGLAEGSFPAPTTDNTTLDFHERKRLREEGLRLETAAERARRERLSFWTLLQVPRQRMVLSYPKVAGGRALLSSPYFELLGVTPTQPSALPAASPEEARRAYLQRGGLDDPVLEHAARCWEVEKRRESAEPFDTYDGMVGVPIDYESRRFSASQLGDLSRCGFKWWAGSFLKLSEPDEGESPALLGSLYHKTLEMACCHAREVEEHDFRTAILRHLDEAFAEAEKEYEMHRLRAWSVRRDQHIELLREAVGAESFVLPGAEVADTECNFTGEWQGFVVAGRVDRVDRTQEGLVLIDYKSGSGVSKPDLQLAIYREAAGPALFPDEEVQGAYYYALRKGERVAPKPPSGEELTEIVERTRANLEAGRLPPDVLERDPAQQACQWCGFDLVCRKGPRLSRKLGREPESEGGET